MVESYSRAAAQACSEALQNARQLCNAFVPSPAGVTRRTTVVKSAYYTLYYYPATGRCSQSHALMLVYALVNRAVILDIAKHHSFIARLCDAGYDVYLLEWSQLPHHTTLADIVVDFLPQAVIEARQHTALSKLVVMGVCQGGVLALCYATLFPDQIDALVTIVTPVDFHASDSDVAQFLRTARLPAAFFAGETISGATINHFFDQFRSPVANYHSHHRFLIQAVSSDLFLSMEHWILQAPAHPAKLCYEFYQRFYIDNALINESLVLRGHLVRLSQLQLPLFNLFACRDHIVSKKSASSLSFCLRNQHALQTYAFDGGHIGIFVSKRANQASRALLAWLATLTD